MIKRQTSLSKNIIQFCRFLRLKNFKLGVEEESTALGALRFIDFNNRNVFRLSLKSVLCRSQRQVLEFDDLFNQYWKEINRAVDAKVKTRHEPVAKPVRNDASFHALKSWLNGNRNEETEETASYSFSENLSQKDFSLVPADEVEDLMRIIKALSKRLAASLNRRFQQSNKVRMPDFRRTLRVNMRRGGELLEIAYRKPKNNRTNVVVLCDVSKSMDLYSAFLLQFMFAFQQVYRRMETYAFGTSLQHITSVLKQNDFAAALKALSTHNESWSGGTRIGECLDYFVNKYATRIVNKQSVIVILSDGWDTGDIHLLKTSMQKIWCRSKKVIWLNPLAGYALYSADTLGMQAALPFIDVFAPVHNVSSLRQLGKWL